MRGTTVKVNCMFPGIDLDGFDSSFPPIVGFHPPHFCPNPINCMLGIMSIRCNSILGITSLHCLPVLSEPYLQCSTRFPIVGLFAVFTWHFIHNPSSHLLSYIRVSSLSSGSAVVFSLAWRLSWCKVHCKLFSSFFLRPRMYVQGAEGLWLFFSGCRWRGDNSMVACLQWTGFQWILQSYFYVNTGP